MITVTGTLGVNDVPVSDAKLIVTTLPNNQFDISMKTGFDQIMSISVYNSLGQVVAFNNLQKDGDGYNYHLDMSYAAAGVYLVKMGDERTGTFQTSKIIVK